MIGVHLGVLSRRGPPRDRGRPCAPARSRPPPTWRSGRHLVPYLRHEVLAPLPDDLRLVLRRTAVLDEFGADLAAARHRPARRPRAARPGRA